MADTKTDGPIPGDSPKPHGDPMSHVTGGPIPVGAGGPEPSGGGAKLHGEAVHARSAGVAGNPAAYDQAAQHGSSPGAGDAAATSKVLHPPGSTIPEAAHHSPGLKLEDAIRSGLVDADPADRPHGNPNRPAPDPIPPGTDRT